MKRLLSILTASALLVSMAACGSSSPSTADSSSEAPAAASSEASAETPEASEASTASGDKVTLTVTFRDDGQGETGSLWTWFKDAYETYDKKDQIELNIAPITASEGDYFAKIALSLQSADTAPDIVTEDTFQLATDVSAGYLTDLGPYLADYPEWTDGTYYESLKTGVTGPDGNIYGVPYSTDTRGLWYNKEIFKQAGLPEDWQPQNWQEILDACAVIKEKVPDVVPFWCNSGIATGEATSMQTYEMLLYGTGERLLEGDKWIVSSPNIEKSLTFLDNIYKNSYGPSLSLVLNGQASNTSAREYLPQGKLAISLDGFWIQGNYGETGASPWPEYKDVLGYVAMPTSEGQDPKTITLAGGWALSIPSKSDAQAEAFDFIKQMMSKDIYLRKIISMGNISTRTDVAVDPAYTELPFMDIATEFLASADFRPQNDKYPVVSTHIQTMVESVVSGTSPADAMAQYAADVTSAVGADNVVSK